MKPSVVAHIFYHCLNTATATLAAIAKWKRTLYFMKKEFYFEMILHSLGDFLENFSVHFKIALNSLSLM